MALALTCGAFAYGIWTVALVWEVIGLGGGPAQLSVVSTAGAVGVLLPALLAGVVADRIPQKLIVMTVATAEFVSYAVVATLSLTGTTQLWELAMVSFFIGMGMAFYYAAYSAWLPALVPASDLLAVNGFEGMVRPLVAQAIGPGVAGVVVGLASPGAACVVAAVAAAAGVIVQIALPRTPVRRDLSTADTPGGPWCAARRPRGRCLHVQDTVAAGYAAVRVADGPGDDGPVRGARAVRHQGPTGRRCRGPRDGPGRVRDRWRRRLARDGVDADASPLPDLDERRLWRRLPAAGGDRCDEPSSGSSSWPPSCSACCSPRRW